MTFNIFECAGTNPDVVGLAVSKDVRQIDRGNAIADDDWIVIEVGQAADALAADWHSDVDTFNQRVRGCIEDLDLPRADDGCAREGYAQRRIGADVFRSVRRVDGIRNQIGPR